MALTIDLHSSGRPVLHNNESSVYSIIPPEAFWIKDTCKVDSNFISVLHKKLKEFISFGIVSVWWKHAGKKPGARICFYWWNQKLHPKTMKTEIDTAVSETEYECS